MAATAGDPGGGGGGGLGGGAGGGGGGDDDPNMIRFFSDRLHLMGFVYENGQLNLAGNLVNKEDMKSVMLQKQEEFRKRRAKRPRLDGDEEGEEGEGEEGERRVGEGVEPITPPNSNSPSDVEEGEITEDEPRPPSQSTEEAKSPEEQVLLPESPISTQAIDSPEEGEEQDTDDVAHEDGPEDVSDTSTIMGASPAAANQPENEEQNIRSGSPAAPEQPTDGEQNQVARQNSMSTPPTTTEQGNATSGSANNAPASNGELPWFSVGDGDELYMSIQPKEESICFSQVKMEAFSGSNPVVEVAANEEEGGPITGPSHQVQPRVQSAEEARSVPESTITAPQVTDALPPAEDTTATQQNSTTAAADAPPTQVTDAPAAPITAAPAPRTAEMRTDERVEQGETASAATTESYNRSTSEAIERMELEDYFLRGEIPESILNDPLGRSARVDALLVRTFGATVAQKINEFTARQLANLYGESRATVESEPPRTTDADGGAATNNVEMNAERRQSGNYPVLSIPDEDSTPAVAVATTGTPTSLLDTIESFCAAVSTTPSETTSQSTSAPEGTPSANAAAAAVAESMEDGEEDEDQVPNIRIRTDIFEDPATPMVVNTEQAPVVYTEEPPECTAGDVPVRVTLPIMNIPLVSGGQAVVTTTAFVYPSETPNVARITTIASTSTSVSSIYSPITTVSAPVTSQAAAGATAPAPPTSVAHPTTTLDRSFEDVDQTAPSFNHITPAYISHVEEVETGLAVASSLPSDAPAVFPPTSTSSQVGTAVESPAVASSLPSDAPAALPPTNTISQLVTVLESQVVASSLPSDAPAAFSQTNASSQVGTAVECPAIASLSSSAAPAAIPQANSQVESVVESQPIASTSSAAAPPQQPVVNSQFEMDKAIDATVKTIEKLAADYRKKVEEMRAQRNVPLTEQFEFLKEAQKMIFRTFEGVDTTKIAVQIRVPELVEVEAPDLLNDAPEPSVEQLVEYFEVLFEATTLSKRTSISEKMRGVLVVMITRILRILGFYMVENRSQEQSDQRFNNVSAVLMTRLHKYYGQHNVAFFLTQLWSSIRTSARGASYTAGKLDHVNLGPKTFKDRVDKFKASWEKSQRAAGQQDAGGPVPSTSQSAIANSGPIPSSSTAVPQAQQAGMQHQQMRPQFNGIGTVWSPQAATTSGQQQQQPSHRYLQQLLGGPPPRVPPTQYTHEQQFRASQAALAQQQQQYQQNNSPSAYPGNNAASYSGGSMSQVRPQPPQYQGPQQMQQYPAGQISQQQYQQQYQQQQYGGNQTQQRAQLQQQQQVMQTQNAYSRPLSPTPQQHQQYVQNLHELQRAVLPQGGAQQAHAYQRAHTPVSASQHGVGRTTPGVAPPLQPPSTPQNLGYPMNNGVRNYPAPQIVAAPQQPRGVRGRRKSQNAQNSQTAAMQQQLLQEQQRGQLLRQQEEARRQQQPVAWQATASAIAQQQRQFNQQQQQLAQQQQQQQLVQQQQKQQLVQQQQQLQLAQQQQQHQQFLQVMQPNGNRSASSSRRASVNDEIIILSESPPVQNRAFTPATAQATALEPGAQNIQVHYNGVKITELPLASVSNATGGRMGQGTYSAVDLATIPSTSTSQSQLVGLLQQPQTQQRNNQPPVGRGQFQRVSPGLNAANLRVTTPPSNNQGLINQVIQQQYGNTRNNQANIAGLTAVTRANSYAPATNTGQRSIRVPSSDLNLAQAQANTVFYPDPTSNAPFAVTGLLRRNSNSNLYDNNNFPGEQGQ